MTANPGFLLTVLAFLAVIGPLVFVHELGHYLVARWFGVKAEAFSIGFGPELAAWVDKRGTRWRIAALPLGGYVKFMGDMNPASVTDPRWLQLPAHEREQCFQGKPVWQRALIVGAGPAVNFIFAVLLLAGLGLAYGNPEAPPVIGKIAAGSAAQTAKLQKGDRIISVMGREIDSFGDISAIILLRPGEPLAYEIERGGRRFSQTIAAGTRLEKDRFGNIYKLGQLGIGSAPIVRQPVSLIEAPVLGVQWSWRILTGTVDGVGQIITGRRPASELGGPLKIAEVSGQAATMGVAGFIGFMAAISINLGFINLLPIPILDGGHLLFYGVEAVQRRPVSPQVQEWAFRSGMAVLMSLMIFVTFNDLSSFGIWRGLSGLIG